MLVLLMEELTKVVKSPLAGVAPGYDPAVLLERGHHGISLRVFIPEFVFEVLDKR